MRYPCRFGQRKGRPFIGKNEKEQTFGKQIFAGPPRNCGATGSLAGRDF